jgi:hypothetical protein
MLEILVQNYILRSRELQDKCINRLKKKINISDFADYNYAVGYRDALEESDKIIRNVLALMNKGTTKDSKENESDDESESD